MSSSAPCHAALVFTQDDPGNSISLFRFRVSQTPRDVCEGFASGFKHGPPQAVFQFVNHLVGPMTQHVVVEQLGALLLDFLSRRPFLFGTKGRVIEQLECPPSASPRSECRKTGN